MFNIGSNPIELRGNTIFGRRLDGNPFEMAGLFITEPETTIMNTAWDALECLDVYKRQVYTLFDIKKPIIPVTPYKRDPKVLAKALKTAYR